MDNIELQSDALPDWLAGLSVLRTGQVAMYYLAEVESTNTWLKEQLGAGRIRTEPGCRFSALVAGRQTAGRGTRGRTWLQTLHAERDIALSLALPRRGGFLNDQRLSLLLSALVLRVLDSAQGACGLHEGAVLGVKWPNDLLGMTAAGWRKLGGILIESRQDPAGQSWVVIGIGLNVGSRAGDFPPEISGSVTTLGDLLGLEDSPAGNSLKAAIVEKILETMLKARSLEAAGCNELMSNWLSCHQTIGRSYRYTQDGRELKVIVIGVDAVTGALVATDTSGEPLSILSYHGLVELPAAT